MRTANLTSPVQWPPVRGGFWSNVRAVDRPSCWGTAVAASFYGAWPGPFNRMNLMQSQLIIDFTLIFSSIWRRVSSGGMSSLFVVVKGLLFCAMPALRNGAPVPIRAPPSGHNVSLVWCQNESCSLSRHRYSHRREGKVCPITSSVRDRQTSYTFEIALLSCHGRGPRGVPRRRVVKATACRSLRSTLNRDDLGTAGDASDAPLPCEASTTRLAGDLARQVIGRLVSRCDRKSQTSSRSDTFVAPDLRTTGSGRLWYLPISIYRFPHPHWAARSCRCRGPLRSVGRVGANRLTRHHVGHDWAAGQMAAW